MNVWFRQENTDFNRERVEILRKLSKSQVHRLKCYLLSKSIKTAMIQVEREKKIVK